jgi:hypothetical protein
MAEQHQTPEAALAEHIAAYKARDIDRFISSINLHYEAAEQLRRSLGGTREPTEDQVAKAAKALATELHNHFAKFAFKAGTFDNCRSVTKFQDTDSQVRIVLSCSDSRGSTTFPVRVVRISQGWHVVRGG